MLGLNNEQKIIINYIVEKYKITESKIKKDVYKNDLIDYIKINGLSENNSLLIYLNKELESLYLYFTEFNFKNKSKDFEDLLMDLFKNDAYQEYEFNNISLSKDIENDFDKIKVICPNYKISDDLITKLITTMKARVIVKNKADNDYYWAPEALISLELLKIILKEKIELYYITPNSNQNVFTSIINSKIIEQRLNKDWIKRNKSFLDKNNLNLFISTEQTVLTDLLDFLPELESVKLGISMSFPERVIVDRLNLILIYFQKSEIDIHRKKMALNIINKFFDEFIYKNNKNLYGFEKCKEIIKSMEQNIENNKKEEMKLTLSSKVKNINNNEMKIDTQTVEVPLSLPLVSTITSNSKNKRKKRKNNKISN